MNFSQITPDAIRCIKQIKLIIFDLDGTLLFTLNSLRKATQLALMQSKNLIMPSFSKVYDPVNFTDVVTKTIESPQFMNCVGYGARNQIRLSLYLILGEEPAPAVVDQIWNLYLLLFKSYYNYHIDIYSGLNPMLRFFQNHGIQLAVASNKPESQAKDLIRQYFSKIPFLFVAGATPDRPLKPEPGALRAPLHEHGFDFGPEIAIMGDGEPDIRMAQNCKALPLAALWGYRTKEQLLEAGADPNFLFPLPDDVIQLFTYAMTVQEEGER